MQNSIQTPGVLYKCINFTTSFDHNLSSGDNKL